MNTSIRTGFSFGLTSSIITTLGLIIGLHSGTHSKLVIVGGILTIAIADSGSDALGIHISEEYDKKSEKNVWLSTMSTFITKLFFALTFLIPVLLLNLKTAMIVSIIWGLAIIGILSYYIAKKRKAKPIKIIAEHIIITLIIITATHYAGELISIMFA